MYDVGVALVIHEHHKVTKLGSHVLVCCKSSVDEEADRYVLGFKENKGESDLRGVLERGNQFFQFISLFLCRIWVLCETGKPVFNIRPANRSNLGSSCALREEVLLLEELGVELLHIVDVVRLQYDEHFSTILKYGSIDIQMFPVVEKNGGFGFKLVLDTLLPFQECFFAYVGCFVRSADSTYSSLYPN
eukprot:gb/GEZJ01001902.1/.p2 GENE.gb/GEZJ01001902.1/~~gb/GEZJ01001902.1/.p2  ORF type:complete len:189 (-),score=28.28 gb/GEZJ01001902.1/:1994-2560(-)